jgi:peptidoglycan L-alanyl-D-glutamate endopeptidase CwlK
VITDQRRKELNVERVAALEEGFSDAVTEVLNILEVDGYKPLIVQGLRTIEEQDAIYAQGREELSKVNELREVAGLDPIDESENKIRTKVRGGKSKHNFGKAVDIVNIDDSGNADWDDLDFFRATNEIFKDYGATWGGDWRWKDYPHWEID